MGRRRSRRYLAIHILTAVLSSACSSSRTPALEDFSVQDHRGGRFALKHEAQVLGSRAIAFIFVGVGCPIAEKSFPIIERLAAEYKPQRVEFVFVDSTPQDDPAGITKEANDFRLSLPILLDSSQVIARSFGVNRTATAVLIDTGTWRTIYQGAIDDRLSYLDDKAEAKHPYLRNALDDFLAGRTVRASRTQVSGCAITPLD